MVTLPDLDIQDAGQSYPPTLSASSVVAGGSVTFTYRLSNWGPGSAPSSITGIYSSSNSTISTSDTRIGTDPNAAISGVGGLTETFTIDTTGWAAGTYYIGAIADYNNAVAESNESNNPSSGVMLTVTAPPVQLPDLDIQDAGQSYPPTLSASSVVAGGSVTFTYRLSNWGPGSAPSSITGIYSSSNSTISTSDTRIGTDPNAAISGVGGLTETFTIDTTGWAAGTYYIGAIADYNNAITEGNESNNPSSGVMLTVTAPVSLLPDLDVQNVGESFPPTLSASSVTAGGSVTLSYRLSNFGPGNAPSSVTGIYRSTDGTISISDTRIDTDTNAGFTGVAGRTETATINTTGWAPGTYYIGAIADYNNAITEGNESNNPSSGVMLTVTAPTTTTDAGNTRATATALTPGSTVAQSVGISPDTDDYFSFTAASTGRVTAKLTGLSADIDLRALNGAGTEIDASLAGSATTGTTANEFVSFNVVAGQTYYLHVDPEGTATSNYSLATTFTPSTTPQVASSFRLPFANLSLTQEYGVAGALTTYPTFKHLGEDYGGSLGSSILAAANGKVIAAVNTSPTTGFGNYVIIEHALPDGTKMYSLYGHMSYLNAKVNDVVRAGDQIGIIGETGAADGRHLHFEISLVNMFITGPASDPSMFRGGYDSPGQWTTSSHYTYDPSNFISGARFGNSASNTLIGSTSDNFFFGGLGNDTVTSGAGYDSFIFSTALGSTNVDTITDFSVANDTILLSRAIFSSAGAIGKLAAGAFNTGSAALQADDRIIYNSTNGALIYDSNGNVAGGAVQFATLSAGLTSLSAADFFLF